jgi:alpha-beta hydrolase superfamily lysophospholipase
MLRGEPNFGILLIHGMSDSPYLLKHFGDELARLGGLVIGLRVPGHGTIPSGLVRVQWEDMAAAVSLAMEHLQQKLGERPLYILGYSNGGALALHHTLTSLENDAVRTPDRIVLMSRKSPLLSWR